MQVAELNRCGGSMRLSLIALALSLGVAAPAFAERKVCHVMRTANSLISQTGAVLEPKFDRLLVQQGPFFGTDVKIRDKDVGWAPVREADPGLAFYMYWYGDEAPGKTWREPGSIPFRLGGFAVMWPNFEDGRTARLHSLRTVVKMNGAVSDRSFTLDTVGLSTSSSQVFTLDKRMWSEWPYNWDHRTFFEDEWAAWIAALETGGKMTVEFWDNGDTPFATAEVTLPALKVWNDRAVADIGDFRAKVDPKDCVSGPRITLP